MDWRHEVSVDWLKARRDVITATELVGLMSGFTKLTKAQKAGTQVAPAFAALWGQKHSVMDPDPVSYGAAARGHFMEPYAVEDYVLLSGEEYYHWDDCIICNNGLGFSPDAMDISMKHNPTHEVRMDISKGKLTSRHGGKTYIAESMPKKILEIKSYGIDNHMKNMVMDKMQLKERYQIAVAMMVIPTLEEGTLVQYCPQLESFSMFCRKYTRTDLEDDIAKLSEILDVWQKTCRWFDSNESEMESTYSEKEIKADYDEQNQEPIFKL